MDLSNHIKPQKYNTVVDYHSTLQQNEIRMNRVSGLLAIFTLAVVGVMFLINHLGIYFLKDDEALFVLIIVCPLCLFSFFISNILKISKPWVKYALTINECLIVMLMNSFLGINTVLLYALPLLKASLYYNRKLTIFAGVATVIVMLLSHILNVYLSIAHNDPFSSSVYKSIVFGLIPQLSQYLLIFITVWFLSTSTSSMMNSLYRMADKNEKLVQDMMTSQYEIVNNLATISDNKSPETGDHIGRVFRYMRVLAHAAGYSKDEAYDIALASMLHDIGKLCIDEKIISAPRDLTDEEFEIVKKHVVYGRDILQNSASSVLQTASVIAYEHHENYDGTGYLGIKGNDIDILARMMSVVDVFDALTSTRSYKKAWSKKEALAELIRLKGTKFDPAIVDLFAANFDSMSQICDRLNPDSH